MIVTLIYNAHSKVIARYYEGLPSAVLLRLIRKAS